MAEEFHCSLQAIGPHWQLALAAREAVIVPATRIPAAPEDVIANLVARAQVA